MRRVDLLRVWAGGYFVAQFLVVHVVFFGFDFEPASILWRAPEVFGWESIAHVLGQFWQPFVGGFAFGSVLVVLIFAVPFVAWLLWVCLPLMLYLYVLWQFVWWLVIKLRQVAHVRHIKLDNVVIVKSGAPGCGKSSSGLYEAVVMARKMWKRLQYKYFVYSSKVNKWRKDASAPTSAKQRRALVKLAEWEEIKFSYNYFRKRGARHLSGELRPERPHAIHARFARFLKVLRIVLGRNTPGGGTLGECSTAQQKKRAPVVPCLVTNIPVMVDGRFTCQLTKKHLAQRKRLPAYSVLFVDEIGAMVNVDMHRDRANKKNPKLAEVVIDLDNFFRLCRHFGEFRIICTEQRRDNIYIGVRNVVSKVEVMQSQTWVLKPYPVLVAFGLLRFVAMCFNRPNDAGRNIPNKVLAPWLILFERLTHAVGFRKYQYTTESGAQGLHATKLKGKRTFYLQSMLNFRYDERTYRNLYKCKDEPTPEPWTSLTIEDTPDNRDNFLRKVMYKDAPDRADKKGAA